MVVLGRIDKKWLENYNSFKEYVIENAKLPSSGMSSSLGVDLYGWFRNQRNSYKSGKLSQDKVSLLNNIVEGVLEKNIRDTNVDLYIKYGNDTGDKYNPNVVYLYKNDAVDFNMLKYCVGKGIQSLKELLASVNNGVNMEKLLHMVMQRVYELPEYCYCSLYCAIIKAKDLSSLYLEDSQRFVDYHVNGIKNLKTNCDAVLSSARISKRRRELLSAYYGLDTGRCCSLREVATRYNISIETVRSSISGALGVIRDFMESGSYGSLFENCTLSNPYEADFSSINSMSVRTFRCLKRMGINSFKELHDYLISVSKNDDSVYSGGLSTIRNMGVVSAREVCDIARKYGIYDKVFGITEEIV